MHTKFLSWLSLLGVLALFTLESAAQGAAGNVKSATLEPGARAGKIKAMNVQGEVTYRQKGSSVAATKLAEGSEISQGSIVNTAAGGNVVLLFENGASIKLSPESELDIMEFMLDPVPEKYERKDATAEPSFSNTEIKLVRGELIGNVKKLKRTPANESKFRVSTPVGAAGIRGTTFKIVYRPDGSGRAGFYNFTLTTIEGHVEVVIGSGVVNVAGSKTDVMDNKEVKIEVNTNSGQLTATTDTGQKVVIATAAPAPVVDAPVTTVQQVQAVAKQLVAEIAKVVFTPAPAPAPGTLPKDDKKDAVPKEEKKEPASAGPTTEGPRTTPGT